MLIYSIGDMPNDFDKRLKDIEDAIEDLEMRILKLQLEIDYLKVVIKKQRAKKLKLLSRYSLKSYF
tara:strand:+ start:2185 stop:2382 length:198 start_codon:yes stop_codon:yes gene_type:complete